MESVRIPHSRHDVFPVKVAFEFHGHGEFELVLIESF